MLFRYPENATSNNWIHECLCETVQGIHNAVDDGIPMSVFPENLPEPYRDQLSGRTALRGHLREYNQAIRRLTKPERDQVLDALEGQNRIPGLLAGTEVCADLANLPSPVHLPISELFGYGFRLLTELGVRDEFYACIYGSLEDRVCPFCGTEILAAPGGPREDLDHYLPRSIYPFASANLRNLVPMGTRCNSRYKLSINLLFHSDGTRRRAIDPFASQVVPLELSLDQSQPFSEPDARVPRWAVRFTPESEEVATWESVFSCRERYERDHLDPEYSGWLRSFAHAAHRSGKSAQSDEGVIERLAWWEGIQRYNGLKDRSFLRAATFRMLRLHCEAGNRRLLDLLLDLLNPGAEV